MRNKGKITKKLAATVIASVMVGTMLVGGTLAYLTDNERLTNKFTIGKVDVELTEPNWHEEENQKLEAGQTVKKDPTITNVGINDAYVYLEVQVPMIDVITAAADGTRENGGKAAHQQLAKFQANSGWSLISSREINKNMIYTYSYDKILKPKEKTNALFDSVTFANVVEGQIDTNSYNIPAAAYAIQTANTGDGSGNVKQEAKNAYNKYMLQNEGQPGAVVK